MPASRSTASASKQRGSTKPKGAVRAKSGCYTCRIRRKKCDEQLSDGRCRTCVRLRLECLGFGQKRPEWLRESRNVSEVREKIKNFLASHGMIKGHAGSVLPRDAECELPTLRLSEGDSTSDSSQTPPTPTLSLPSDTLGPTSGDRSLVSFHQHHRDGSWAPEMECSQYSPFPLRPRGLLTESIPGMLARDGSRDNTPYCHDQTFYPSPNECINVPSPAMHSTFSPLYNCQFPQEEWNYPSTTGVPDIPRNPPQWIQPDEMVRHYIHHIVHQQYLLVEKAIPDMITDTLSSSRYADYTREAVKLLASVHFHRFTYPTKRAFEDIEVRQKLESLNSLHSSLEIRNPEDAMAALHVVSSILFDGGQGSWKQWLEVANRYVDTLFTRHGTAHVLSRCSLKDAFIIKTAIWFDTLASVTTEEDPHFIEDVRILFGPNRNRNYDQHPQYSMMSPMGCENIIVWALAETSALARWKGGCQRTGSLSVPRLVEQAAVIEHAVSSAAEQPRMMGGHSADLEGRRQMVAKIFRLASRLYLCSVVSGDHPQVDEIKVGVSDMMECIRPLVQRAYEGSDQQLLAAAVVRSTVLGFFICGALADEGHDRDVINQLLARHGEGAGNSGSVRALLNELWEQRRRESTTSRGVEWRWYLRSTETLLV